MNLDNNLQDSNLKLIIPHNQIIYPFTIAPIIIKDKQIILALEHLEHSEVVVIKTKKDLSLLSRADDFYKIGVVGEIIRVVKLDDGNLKVLFQGNYKVKINDISLAKLTNEKIKNNQTIEILMANCLRLNIGQIDDVKKNAILDLILEKLEKMSKIEPSYLPFEILKTIEETKDLDKCIDLVLNICEVDDGDIIKIFSEENLEKRANMLLEMLEFSYESMNYAKKLKRKVGAKIEKTNKDYFLRQQLKQIQAELGDVAQKDEDILKYQELLKTKKPFISKAAYKEIDKQIQKLARQGSDTSESAVIQTYIETVLDIPFEKCKEEKFSYDELVNELAKNHYGLKEPKERIEEFFATKSILKQRVKKDNLRTILCFVGPPGVGKTSLAVSISKALNKKIHKISLGGLEDINELKGHRRTYVGAMPGRIVQGFIEAKTMNVLFVLDEIDKLNNSYKGDPSSVFLEILDPEQNDSFRDYYLNFDIDLSNIVFIATANDISRIPSALRDRMEIIELSSYTQIEKFHIAKEHLIDDQMQKHAIKKTELIFKDEAINMMIEEYTREAGVRKLKEQIAKICRKFNKQMLEGKKKLTINTKNLDLFLEKKVYEQNKCDTKPIVGQINGLAYTSVGGDLLKIQAITYDGKGTFELTGMLGDVMKESAKIALNVAKLYIDKNKIKKPEYEKKNIFLHAPDGATPKDGPSAGLAMTCVLVSTLTNTPLRQDIAMTGEVDLLGNALPIGGLKEKLIAAYKAGVKEVFIPSKNKEDLKWVPDEVKQSLKINLIDYVEQILKVVLVKK